MYLGASTLQSTIIYCIFGIFLLNLINLKALILYICVMKIIIGSDPFAYSLKNEILKHLESRQFEILDADTFSNEPYFNVAKKAANLVANGSADCGILLCGTGAGLSIVANKVAGVRAVCVESVFAAKKAKTINNANIITMGSMIVGPAMACDMTDAWIDSKFTEGFPGLEGFLNDALNSVKKIDLENRKA